MTNYIMESSLDGSNVTKLNDFTVESSILEFDPVSRRLYWGSKTSNHIVSILVDEEIKAR